MLQLDDWSQRITVHSGNADDFLYMGFEVEDKPTLEALADHLRANGHEVTAGSEDTCKARKVKRLVHLRDPDGINLELFIGPSLESSPFISPLVKGGFYTGDARVWCFALGSADRQKKIQFYQSVLKMKLSDQIIEGDLEVTFL